MYRFMTEKKDELLQGRKISYIANKILKCNYNYFAQVLRGEIGCSFRLAKDIIALSNNSDAKIEDYFEIIER